MYFEEIVNFLSEMQWYWVFLIAFGVTVLENVFPPSPCDSVLVFTGSLVAIGTVSFVPLLLVATAGSVIGFLIMFFLGKKFDYFLDKRKPMKFLSLKLIKKVERWFQKYGYWVIIANRFLTGTRAVISFFAGMSNLKLTKTTILSAVSALVWNTILISLGYFFADNFEMIIDFLELYAAIILPIIAIAIGVTLFFYFRRKRREKLENLAADNANKA